jgi:hypothetical protein
LLEPSVDRLSSFALFLFVLWCWGATLGLLAKHSTSELHPQALDKVDSWKL